MKELGETKCVRRAFPTQNERPLNNAIVHYGRLLLIKFWLLKDVRDSTGEQSEAHCLGDRILVLRSNFEYILKITLDYDGYVRPVSM